MITKPRVLCHLFYDINITTTQTPHHRIQSTARSLLPNFHRAHPYYTTKPPPTHYTQNAYYYFAYVYSTPRQRSSQFTTFIRKYIFIAPCLRWENTNLPTYPRQGGGRQVGGIVTLHVESMPQEFLPSSSNITLLPLNIPPSLLKSNIHQNIAYSSIPSLRTPFTPLTCGI